MKIGALAQSLGITTDTIRFYEKQGLLGAPRRADNGYRVYGEADKTRMQFILRCKLAGFSLQEIEQLLQLRLDRETAHCADVKRVTQQKLERVEARIKELVEVKATLSWLVNNCCGGQESAMNCTILEALESENGPFN